MARALRVVGIPFTDCKSDIMANWSKAKDLLVGALTEVKKLSEFSNPAGSSGR